MSLVQNTSLTDGEPIPNSPGSMVNQYRLDEDDVEQHLGIRDLFITVDKPESHVTTIETFITYRVVTKVGTSPYSSVLLCRTNVTLKKEKKSSPVAQPNLLHNHCRC